MVWEGRPPANIKNRKIGIEMEHNKTIGNKKRWKAGEYDTSPVYYVYEWKNVENGHVFYVGKGKGDRYKTKAPSKRNRFFVRYVNSHECEPSIIKDGLTEKEAFDLEKATIAEYRKSSQCECNFEDGGGDSGSARLFGELNPMWHRTHTKEAREKMREANLGGRNAGKNNAQYGIKLRDRMTQEQYDNWKIAHHNAQAGSKNVKAVALIATNEDGVELRFNCIKEFIEFLVGDTVETDSKIDNHYRSKIKVAVKRNKRVNGYLIRKIPKGNDVPSLREGEGATTRETAGGAGEGSTVGASEMTSRSAKQLSDELKK